MIINFPIESKMCSFNLHFLTCCETSGNFHFLAVDGALPTLITHDPGSGKELGGHLITSPRSCELAKKYLKTKNS